MSDLRRWLDSEPPSEVRRLLEAAEWARPSRGLLEQTLANVHAGAVPNAGDAAFPTPQDSALKGGLKWTLVGALLLGSIGAVTYGLRSEQSAHGEVQPLPAAKTELAVAPAAQPPAARPEPEPARVAIPSTVELAAKPAAQKPRAVSAPASAPARASESAALAKVCKPGVVEQIEMLERAKGLIRSGRGAQALAILDRYDAFGAGRCFVPESLKHRMDAYALTGNTKGAARTATSIKNDYPDTAQARSADAVLKQK